MSQLEWILVGGIGILAVSLISIESKLARIFNLLSSPDFNNNHEIESRLNSLEQTLEAIERHTARVAEPLYDQDAFDLEHLTGKYTPPY